MLEPKIWKPLEITGIQFTSGHISINCSPLSQTFITIPFLYGFSKQPLSKRFHHVSALCICFLRILNYTAYSIFRSMIDKIAVTRRENRSMMWDLGLLWRRRRTLLAPKYSKEILRNTSCYDIRYCLENSIPIEIVLYDITNMAVPIFRTLIRGQKRSKFIMLLGQLKH
jgi:hypothetical protein